MSFFIDSSKRQPSFRGCIIAGVLRQSPPLLSVLGPLLQKNSTCGVKAHPSRLEVFSSRRTWVAFHVEHLGPISAISCSSVLDHRQHFARLFHLLPKFIGRRLCGRGIRTASSRANCFRNCLGANPRTLQLRNKVAILS